MSMIENTSRTSTGSDPAAIESLKLLLDYAIAEGDELQLPVFVLLLRMANLELAKSAGGDLCPNANSLVAQDALERVAP